MLLLDLLRNVVLQCNHFRRKVERGETDASRVVVWSCRDPGRHRLDVIAQVTARDFPGMLAVFEIDWDSVVWNILDWQ